jgi:uncharacterized protein YoxC
MLFHIVSSPEPEPMPTITQMPDLAPAADLSGAIAGIATLVILALGGLAWRKVSSLLAEMTTDVKATKIQTTNSHKTNLRDDLTDAVNTISDVACAMEDVKESMKKMEDRQQAMHEDLRETRKDVRFATEYTRDVDKRLISHIDESSDKNGGSNE